jgi:transcriptional regulator with XRE-family HTH domain
MNKGHMTRLRAERLRRGWSQQFLAVRAGVGVADVSRIENGRFEPYRGQAEKIANALGIRPEELLQHVRLEVATR